MQQPSLQFKNKTVQTKEFELTKKQLFHINLQLSIKKAWLNLILLPPVMLLASVNIGDTVSNCVFLFGVGYLLLFLYAPYKASYLNAYPMMLAPRTLEFTPLKIKAAFGGKYEFEPSIINELPADSVINAVELKTYFVLYVSRSSFVVVPKDSFHTIEDVNEFKTLFFTSRVSTFKPLQ